MFFLFVSDNVPPPIRAYPTHHFLLYYIFQFPCSVLLLLKGFTQLALLLLYIRINWKLEETTGRSQKQNQIGEKRQITRLDYRIRLQDQITELDYRVRLQGQITVLDYRVRLQDQITGLDYRIRLQDQITGLDYRVRLQG